jgi:hypothetical protein
MDLDSDDDDEEQEQGGVKLRNERPHRQRATPWKAPRARPQIVRGCRRPDKGVYVICAPVWDFDCRTS